MSSIFEKGDKSIYFKGRTLSQYQQTKPVRTCLHNRVPQSRYAGLVQVIKWNKLILAKEILVCFSVTKLTVQNICWLEQLILNRLKNEAIIQRKIAAYKDEVYCSCCYYHLVLQLLNNLMLLDNNNNNNNNNNSNNNMQLTSSSFSFSTTTATKKEKKKRTVRGPSRNF